MFSGVSFLKNVDYDRYSCAKSFRDSKEAISFEFRQDNEGLSPESPSFGGFAHEATPLQRKRIREVESDVFGYQLFSESKENPTSPIFSRYPASPIFSRCSTPPMMTRCATHSTSPFRENPETVSSITYKNHFFNIFPLINSSPEGGGVIAKGYHSVAYGISQEEKEMIGGIRNDSLVIKIPYSDRSRRWMPKGAITVDSVKQYKKCIERGIIDVAEIFNIETCQADGFIIQKKIKPFTKAPWDQSESLKTILEDPIRKSYLDQIIEVCASCFINMGDYGIDLKWDNLGIELDENSENRDKLILFDFLEEKEEFHLIYKICLDSLSNGNNHILENIRNGVKHRLDEAVNKELLIHEDQAYYSVKGKEKTFVAFDKTLNGEGFIEYSVIF